MGIPTRDFTDIVRDMAAAITASAGRLVDVSVGSVLRAIIEANAAVVLWIQWLVLLTLQTTRAATSTGADLDSWMADFSFSRLAGATSTGRATFSRYSVANTAFIPIGTQVKTRDGSTKFAVSADASNPAWDSILNGYTLASGVTAIDLPIVATMAGLAGNVLPNTITVLASAVVGIDTIYNGAPTSGGGDPESDAAFRMRFGNYFAARSRATLDAVGYAISSVAADLNYVIQENVSVDGIRTLGNMLIVVGDRSGYLGDTLLSSLSVAIEAVRPIGTTFSFQAPQISQVQVNLSILVPPNLSLTAVQDQLQSAIENYICNLPIGNMLSVTRISQLAYSVEPQITNVSNVILNGQQEDLAGQPTTSFMPQSVTFN